MTGDIFLTDNIIWYDDVPTNLPEKMIGFGWFGFEEADIHWTFHGNNEAELGFEFGQEWRERV